MNPRSLDDAFDVPPVPTGFVPKVMPPGAVGDVNSTAKGSGARFNAGKAPLDLIPLRIIAESYGNPQGRVGGYAIDALKSLGKWQETGGASYLYDALNELGPDIWLECAKVLDYGRGKYAEWNWAKGMQWSIPLGCAARHCLQIIEGEEMDSESKCGHRGHVAANIVMLLTFKSTFPEGDNRPRTLAPA